MILLYCLVFILAVTFEMKYFFILLLHMNLNVNECENAHENKAFKIVVNLICMCIFDLSTLRGSIVEPKEKKLNNVRD